MIFSLPGPYLRYTRSVPCFLSSMRRKFLMNPSSLRISVMRSLSLEDGMSTFSCSARLALRMRVRRSAIGSLIDMSGSSPAGLDHARHLALEGKLAEAEAAELELSDEAARTPAQLAAVVDAGLELGGLVQALRLHDERGLGHAYDSLKGTPRWPRSDLASSSVWAEVTMITSMPRTLSTLSNTTSGKITCSLRPRA